MTTLILFIFGTCCGSFFSLVGNRALRGISIIWPRSSCQSCQKPLAWFDLLPLASLLTRFRCRYCHAIYSKISFFWELVTGFLMLFIFHLFQVTPFAPLFSTWLLTTLLLAIMDSYHREILLGVFGCSTLALLTIAMLQNYPLHFFQPLLLALTFLVIAKLLPHAFGLGDQLILIVWSLFLPLTYLCSLILVAALSGLIIILLSKLTKKPLVTLPFIPYLFFALWGVLSYLVFF